MPAAADGRPAGPPQDRLVPGDDEFTRLTEPYRPELLAHCYRMLGSVYDAEDQVQETLVRAWRSYAAFQGRASLRTWLYRIATNACLRAIENRSRRPLPSGLAGPNEAPRGPLPAELPEVPWLQPIPDAMLGGGPADPAAIAVAHEGVRLALVAALQYLPARQRAVLILRDVLSWRAAEVAELLGSTPTAVNSALQRARDQLRQVAPAKDEMREPADAGQRELLDRYAAAFEKADVNALMRLLREDAVLEMPPQPIWFAGRDLVGSFLATRVLTARRAFRMIPTAANGQPAFAAYIREANGVYRAHAIQVLTVSGAHLARLVSFNDPGLFPAFALPSALDATAPAAEPG